MLDAGAINFRDMIRNSIIHRGSSREKALVSFCVSCTTVFTGCTSGSPHLAEICFAIKE